MKQQIVNRDINRIKKKVKKCIKKNQLECALQLICCAASILCQTNVRFQDDELEESLFLIGNKLISSIDIGTDSNAIIFYDGAGLDLRGVSYIYLKALLENGYHVDYLLGEKKYGKCKKTIELIAKYPDSKIICLREKSECAKVKELAEIISSSKAKYAFLYPIAEDEVSTCVWNQLAGKRIRYLIDITDHTFWIGTNSFDYCIEFRNYGIKIAMDERKISRDKLLILPYYPIVDKSIPFEEMPFDWRKKFFFSGGSLYKTKGDNNLYYEMVAHILEQHKELYFYYLGGGDTAQLKLLKSKYPERVFYEDERKDFYHIMEKCCFYLSTYPMWGGLMTQYAVIAGKLPLTLFQKKTVDVVLQPEKLTVLRLSSAEEVYKIVEQILSNDQYKAMLEKELENQIISEEGFRKNLNSIIREGYSEYHYENKYAEKDSFKSFMHNKISISGYIKLFATKRYYTVIRFFPVKGGIGGLIRICTEMKSLMKK